MLETILANDWMIYLISLGVFLITILICGRHYKKYGFLQAIFSIICVPMLVHGLGLLLGYIFRDNIDMVEFFNACVYGLNSIKELFIELFKIIGIAWFYETAGFYLPFGVLYVLTYGYSITWYKKRKKNKKEEEKK